MVRESLMYLFGVQTPVTHQFPREKQHRNFVPEARARLRIGVDIGHIDREGLRGRQGREFQQHFLA